MKAGFRITKENKTKKSLMDPGQSSARTHFLPPADPYILLGPNHAESHKNVTEYLVVITWCLSRRTANYVIS